MIRTAQIEERLTADHDGKGAHPNIAGTFTTYLQLMARHLQWHQSMWSLYTSIWSSVESLRFPDTGQRIASTKPVIKKTVELHKIKTL
jgi:hypothetical protein